MGAVGKALVVRAKREHTKLWPECLKEERGKHLFGDRDSELLLVHGIDDD